MDNHPTVNVNIHQSTTSKIDQIDFDHLEFGQTYSDHMMFCDYKDGKWQTPQIVPYGPMEFSPSTKVFHYGQAVFEGVKAFKDKNGDVNIFRPDQNFIRINRSSERMAIPEFPEEYFFESLKHLVYLDRDWVPGKDGSSLYIRPFVIATEEGVAASESNRYRFMIITCPTQTYYSKPIKVLIADQYSRAASGGPGYAKAAGNYGAQFYPTKLAKEKGYQQIIWTDANKHEFIEEAGTMNVFFRINDELYTSPTNDRILDGVTRKSIIQLAEDDGIKVHVGKVPVDMIIKAQQSGELKEIFGSGTAATVLQITGFEYKKELYELPELDNPFSLHFKKRLQDIQYNKAEDEHGWLFPVK